MMARRDLLVPLSRVGLSQPVLQVYDRIFGLLGDCLDIEVSLPQITPSEQKGHVLFPHFQGIIDAYRYCILGRAFAERGYTPLFVVYDDASLFPTPNRPSFEITQYKIRKMINKFGFKKIYLSDCVTKKGSIEDTCDGSCRNITKDEIAEFAKGSVRKRLQIYQIDSDEASELLKKFSCDGVILAQLFNNIYDSFDISVVFSHDPRYSWGGIPLHIARERGIPAYSSTLGWKNKSLVLSNIGDRNSLPQYEERQFVQEFMKSDLSEQQEDRVDEVMKNRVSGGDNARIDYPSDSSHIPDISDDRVSVGMFTNLIWDGNVEAVDGIFSDVFDWIESTIDIFSNSEQAELVIKPHPAEYIRGTNESMYTWINETYSTLPENVSLLEPDTSVNTYRMIDAIDRGVVFNSSVGFEMPYFETPTTTVAEAHYSDLGITHDPESKTEYGEKIDNPDEFKITETMVRRARKYIYFLFEKKHLHFPFIDSKDGEYRLLNIDEQVLDANSEVLEQIVTSSLLGDPILESRDRAGTATDRWDSNV